MTPDGYPLGRYAYGSTIAFVMHAFSVVPRIFWEAGRAQSDFSLVSRLGPTVPVAPAAARVWHEAQVPTPVKICLPAAGVVPLTEPALASAPVSWPGSAATWAT